MSHAVRVIFVLVLGLLACRGQGTSTAHLAAARPPIYPPSWGNALWVVDNAGSLPCSSDANTCTSMTCGASGVGPCRNFAEVIARWGTSEPVIAQATRAVFLSDDSEPTFDLNPMIAVGGSFVITGSFTTVTSGTLGTVVQKNRATPQLLTANLGQSATPYVGLLLSDTTRGTYSWLDPATSGNVATLTQPFPSIVDCTTFPFESDTVAQGDAYQILQPSKVPIRSWNPSLRNQSFFASGTVCLENVWVPDPSGTPGTASFDFNISGEVNQARVDPGAFVRIDRQRQEPAYHYNNYWNGGLNANATTQNAPGIVGGDIYPSESQAGNIANNGAFILDGDVICHRFVLMANTSGFIAAAYIKSHLEIIGSTVNMGTNIAGPALWGPGFLQVGANTTLIYHGTTAAAAFLLTGGVFFGDTVNLTTASAYDDAGAWHPGITINPANIDKPIVDGGFGGAAIDPALHASITTER